MTISAHAHVPPANRLIDADTVTLTVSHKADNVGRFPTNQPYTGRAAVEHMPAAEDVELIERAARTNPAGVHQLAEAIRTGCPPWCSEDHRGQVTDVDGFTLGLAHERIVTELTAQDPAWTDRPATATVLVESTTERGEVVTEPRVVLSVAEGEQGQYVGSEDTQGWTGTAGQARALAAALLAAAELVDGGDR